jgi:hypothetical protein
VPAKVTAVTLGRHRVLTAWGRRRRPVREVRAETASGHVVHLTLLDDEPRPAPADVVVLVGRVPVPGETGPATRRAATRGLAAVVVVGGRPRDPVLPPRLVHVPSAGPGANRCPSASGEARL